MRSAVARTPRGSRRRNRHAEDHGENFKERQDIRQGRAGRALRANPRRRLSRRPRRANSRPRQAQTAKPKPKPKPKPKTAKVARAKTKLKPIAKAKAKAAAEARRQAPRRQKPSRQRSRERATQGEARKPESLVARIAAETAQGSDRARLERDAVPAQDRLSHESRPAGARARAAQALGEARPLQAVARGGEGPREIHPP